MRKLSRSVGLINPATDNLRRKQRSVSDQPSVIISSLPKSTPKYGNDFKRSFRTYPQILEDRETETNRTYLETWKVFCTSREVNPLCGTVTNGIDFLVTQYKHGLTYSSLNTARCALSTVILLPNGITFENQPLVKRLMKGVFESRPTLPRYNSIWNVSTVLDFINTLGPDEELSLKNVTLKCVTLVALLSRQRCQTIHALRISGMKETNGQICFDIFTLLKTSKPG